MSIDAAWLEKAKNTYLRDPMELSVYCRRLDESLGLADTDCVMPSASLIKVPIMIHAFRRNREGHLPFDKSIAVYDPVEGGSFGHVAAGTVVTIGTLVQHMIVESDNTCTNMLIDLLGMDKINEEIQHQGMKQTILQRKMMDFEAAVRGKENKTTPSDMGHIFYQLAQGQCLGEAIDRKMIEILLHQEDNCILPAQIPNPIPVAHKTGELDGIYHDCGIIWKPNAPYICCLMAQHITHEAQAIYDMSYLARAIYDEM